MILDAILPHINALKRKVYLLTSEYCLLKDDNIELHKQKIKLTKKIQELEGEVEILKKRMEVVDVTKGISVQDSNSVGFARKRINNLIRQIDKCISLLND